MCYLKKVYEIIDIALDNAHMFEDWDRQVRLKNENDIRTKLAELNKIDSEVNSVKLNLK